MDGISPVNWLLEMLITCIGCPVVDGSLWRSPFRLLKLTSKTTMLLDHNSSAGRPPESELHDRLRLSRLVMLPSDGEIRPSRPMEASEISVTAPSASQVIPFHVQQFVPFLQEVLRPESCESPWTNLRREILSCSMHTQLVGESRESNGRRARPSDRIGHDLVVLLFLFHEEWSGCMVSSMEVWNIQGIRLSSVLGLTSALLNRGPAHHRAHNAFSSSKPKL